MIIFIFQKKKHKKENKKNQNKRYREGQHEGWNDLITTEGKSLIIFQIENK